jgi:hypothetical protein
MGRERAVGVAFGLMLPDVSGPASRFGRRMQGDVTAFVGEHIELPACGPCRREDAAGCRPCPPADLLVLFVLLHASLGLERGGNLR